jgi:hypothetical protein
MTWKKLYFAVIALTVLSVVWINGFSSNSIFGSLAAKANGYYLEISAGSPLVQNWTDTTLLPSDDDWTQIVAIEGFSGDTLAPTPGTDPRTILADNPGNPLDVKANQTNPSTSILDGVAEFEIANPTIALKASDTATAPNIVIHLNTTVGCAGKGVLLNFNARDIDGSANNSVTPIAVQYRIGGIGNYTNINASFVPDATTGPKQATLVTPVRVTLPISASNQPQLDLRIITSNQTGTDEWVGIDDIFVDCIHPTSAVSSVGGRVTDRFGRGISKAQVTVLNMTTGESKTILTSPFGMYNVEDLPIGDFYLISAGHKQFQFGKGASAFQLLEDLDNMNFIAE